LRKVRDFRRFPFGLDLLLATISGALATMVFYARSGWAQIQMDQPLLYFGDPLYYANLVRNAQIGDALFAKNLGAPLGQQFGLSAYGYEWIQNEFVALFASLSDGPWLAINRFVLYTFWITAFCAYISLRLLNLHRLPSFFGAITFAVIPYHQPYSVGLANMSGFVLMLAVLFRIMIGKSLTKLFTDQFDQRYSERFNRALNLSLLVSVVLFQLTSTLYYLIFTIILTSTLIGYYTILTFDPRKLKRLVFVLFLQVAVILLDLAPIIFSRLKAGLSLSEQSTGDRRPFAAYINGGDPLALFMPFSERSIYFDLASKFPRFRNFYIEYSSQIKDGYEYIIYPGGLIVLLAALLLILVLFGTRFKPNSTIQWRSLSYELRILVGLLLLCIAWYSRSGLGTLLSFLFPYVRGYARFSVFVIFLSIAVIAMIASQARNIKIKFIALILLILGSIDVASNIYVINQSNSISMVRIVGESERERQPSESDEISFRSLGHLGTTRLVDFAEKKLESECSVQVLPMSSFMVDFNLGVVSYYNLDLIKPGLEPSSIRWSSGGISGTPNNSFTDRWLPSYQKGSYGNLLQEVKSQGSCGILFFRGVQDAFNQAGRVKETQYGKSDELTRQLLKYFGPPCYSDIESAVDLYCLSK
jgi:hypothetical protein